mgnify:CR=1 FL=1
MGQVLDVIELAVLPDVLVLPRHNATDDTGGPVHLHFRNRVEVHNVGTVRHTQRTETYTKHQAQETRTKKREQQQSKS